MIEKLLPGIISLMLLLFSMVIAVVFMILNIHFLYSIIYIMFIITGFFRILFFYCRKCSHIKSHTCRHWLPGLLVNKWFKKSAYPYTLIDIIVVATALLLIIGFPQIWLWNNYIFLILFWSHIIIALLMISLFVCKNCFNKSCKFCPNKNEKK